MGVARDERSRLLKSLPEDDVCQVRDFVKVLLKDPEELSGEACREVQELEKELLRGDWMRREDVRRGDV